MTLTFDVLADRIDPDHQPPTINDRPANGYDPVAAMRHNVETLGPWYPNHLEDITEVCWPHDIPEPRTTHGYPDPIQPDAARRVALGRQTLVKSWAVP